jgi:hypothetical protein
VSAISSQNYTSMSDLGLCSAFEEIRGCAQAPLCTVPRHERDNVRAELNRRKLIPAADWGNIEAGKVVRGMGHCSVLAAWGAPISTSDAGVTSTLGFGRKGAVGLMNGKAIAVTTLEYEHTQR